VVDRCGNVGVSPASDLNASPQIRVDTEPPTIGIMIPNRRPIALGQRVGVILTLDDTPRGGRFPGDVLDASGLRITVHRGTAQGPIVQRFGVTALLELGGIQAAGLLPSQISYVENGRSNLPKRAGLVLVLRRPPYRSGQTYTVVVAGLRDPSGNVSEPRSATFQIR